MPDTNRHIAFMVRSNDYIASAEALLRSIETNELRLRSDDPIDQLVGHSFELSLKARAIQFDPEAEIRKFSHNVLKLYDFLEKQCSDFTDISSEVEQHWHSLLIQDRAQIIKTSGSFTSALDELGLPTEQEIADTPLNLRDDVEWYSARMNTNGNLFRYTETRLETLPQIGIWGQMYHRPRQSLIWATKLVNARTEKEWRASLQKGT